VVIELRDFVTPAPEDSLLGYERKLASAIDNYHDRGYQIAIDNFGNQHSLVSRLWKLNPDFIKLDQALIRQAEENPRLAKTLLGLVKIIKDIGAEPIITGIETQVQLDIALQTGASLIQGYLLGKPASVKNLQSSSLMKRV
jgi:EAL domain-containing protein (putative c-di-GMP-specific phosphodiesterase class I)